MVRDRSTTHEASSERRYDDSVSRSHRSYMGGRIDSNPVPAWQSPEGAECKRMCGAVTTSSSAARSLSSQIGERAADHQNPEAPQGKQRPGDDHQEALGLAGSDTGDIMTAEELRQYQRAIRASLLENECGVDKVDDRTSYRGGGRQSVTTQGRYQ
jgi:hypothetical protein